MGSTSHSAVSTLNIRGSVALVNPNGAKDADGGGEVEIQVRKDGDRIKLSVVMIVGTGDDDATMEIVADLDPAEFVNLVGFERTVGLMTQDTRPWYTGPGVTPFLCTGIGQLIDYRYEDADGESMTVRQFDRGRLVRIISGTLVIEHEHGTRTVNRDRLMAVRPAWRSQAGE